MKISLFLILVSAITLQASSVFSQNKKMTVDMQNVTVREVISEIEKEGGISFLFNDNLQQLNQRVSVSYVDQPIQNVLYSALDQANMTYEEVGENFLVLLPKPDYLKQQEITVTGRITDANTGEGLPGASIVILGTTVGVVTGLEGYYKIDVPDQAAVLVFSFVGYLSREMAVGDLTTINVELQVDYIGIEEVVAIGYGTQIRSRVTGSIERANAEDMARVSVPTVTQALQGRAAGVFIKNQSGQPGENKTAISIRGFGTPLYIVDGMPVEANDFQNLNPNDIESLNILKDAAAAAVYGARAGNGVVLVTTKRGKSDRAQFNYRVEQGFQGLTTLPNTTDSWEYMALYNIRRLDRGQPTPFPIETVDAFRQNQGLDAENYPNVHMHQEIARTASPMLTHDLSLSGGTQNVRYFVSANIFDQTGLEKNVFGKTDTRFKRYNFRGNLDVDVSERFKLNFDMSYNHQDLTGPRNAMAGESWGSGQGIFIRAHRWRPFHSIEELPGGHLDFPRGVPGGGTVNPLNLGSADISGTNEFQRQFTNLKLGGEYKLLAGLSTRFVFNYQGTNRQSKIFQKRGPEYLWNPDTEEHYFVRALNAETRVDRSAAYTQNLNFQYFLNGDHSWGRHSLTTMYVFEFLQRNYDAINAFRRRYDFPIAQLSAGPPSQQFNNDAIGIDKRMGHIGRVSYSYDDKYALEVNARYDGSMKFPEDSRWGFFPSVSGTWNITREAFMQDIVANSFLSFLKLRGSYGRLGYDGIGNFQFLPTYSFRGNYILQDNNVTRIIRNDGIPNPSITWEKMDILNFGLDASFWNGILEGSFDIYQRNRFDVLGRRTLETPPVVGAVLPPVNFQEFENRGMELTLTHNKRINNNLNYSIGGNIGINEEITRNIDEPEYVNKEFERLQTQIDRRRITGDRGIFSPFYLQTDGFFTSQDEIDNWAIIDGNGNRSVQIGDARPIDRNGDGRITGADMISATSGTQPRLTFGFQTRVAWKGLEIVSFWQGAGLFGWNLRWSEEFRAPFHGDGMALQKDIKETYIPVNEYGLPTVRAEDARWPRASGIHNSAYDLYLINGKYLRLKQLQIGYTLPQDILDRLGVDRMKIYAGGINLLTFTTQDFLDPEVDERPRQTGGAPVGNYHPQTRVINFGIEIGF